MRAKWIYPVLFPGKAFYIILEQRRPIELPIPKIIHFHENNEHGYPVLTLPQYCVSKKKQGCTSLLDSGNEESLKKEKVGPYLEELDSRAKLKFSLKKNRNRNEWTDTKL